MKILFVIDSLSSGGGQRMLVNIANQLSSSHTVSIFLYNNKSNFFKEFICQEVSVFESVRYKKNGFDFNSLKILISHIKKNDVVISFLSTANIYCALAKIFAFRTPYITTELSITRKEESIFRKVMANLANYLAKHIICNTHFHANYIRALPGMKKKVSVIWNGVYQYNYKPRFHKNPQEFFFLVAARVAYPKNGMRLLHALHIFYERNKFIPSIIWIGRDDNSSKLSIIMKQQMVSFLNHHPEISKKFSFGGEKKDIYSFYESADALIIPSIYEGVPTVLCEAMFAGCPIIATKIADNEKILGSNEKLGFLCNPFSPIDICLAIERRIKISDKNLKKMTDNARIFARKNFSISKMANQYEKIIKKSLR